ncbi:putative Peptidase M16 family [Candidatus Xenohaliotis californiensis]|uniref:Peptidase M16 family n=1 Tax=Candidatus Xenohaliotis californiensis TaxID=84677 RepID=A0ABM9N9E1_9RICK|nr:putative Peptidase M16 family [Candidatus Xenohaliotis californiensis]
MKNVILILVLLPLSFSKAFAFSWDDVVSFKTGSGFDVMLLENHELPIISMEILLKGQGYATETKDKHGITYLAMHLLNDRLTVANPDDFYNLIDQDGIVLSFSSDVDNSKVYIKSVSSKLMNALDYLHRLIINPSITDDAMKRSKDSIEAEVLHAEESPFFILSKKTSEFAFGKHPYGRVPYGDKNSRNSITADNIKERVAAIFNTANMHISVSGDVDSKVISMALDKYLGSIPKSSISTSKIVVPTLHKSTIIEHFKYNVPQTAISFYAQGVSKSDANFYTATVLNEMLGVGLSSRLMHEIRVKRGLVYSIGTSLVEKNLYSLLIGKCSTKDPEQTIDVIKSILKSFASEELSDDEFNDIKKNITNRFLMSLMDNKTIVMYLSSLQALKLPVTFLSNYTDNINKVKMHNAMKMAKSFLDPDAFTFVTVGN